MRYLVTGATGFTGRHTLPLLIKTFGPAVCFVRPGSNREPLAGLDVEYREGDLSQPETLTQALTGMETLVNIASIGFGHAPGIVKACLEAKVQRAIFIGSTAMFTSLNAKTKGIRQSAEAAIESSTLDYTLLRPTMIYGTPEDRNLWRLIQALKRWPIFPVFGSGEFLQQPVQVEDLAAAIVGALQSPKTIRKAYNISGQNALTYNAMIGTICELLGKKPAILNLPYTLSLALVAATRLLPFGPKLKTEQVRRLNEHKAFPHTEATTDFGYSPRTFREGIEKEIGMPQDKTSGSS